MAGILLLGEMAKNSGANCSSFCKFTAWAAYSKPNSSKAMETLRPLGVGHVYKSIMLLLLSSSCQFKHKFVALNARIPALI